MKNYVALIHKERNSDYGISFPDFPGCVSATSTFDEVAEYAEEALALHVEGMKEDGEKLPKPTTFEEIRPDKDLYAIVLIPYSPKSKAVRINMTIEESLLKKADKIAKSKNMSRSAYFAQLVQHNSQL